MIKHLYIIGNGFDKHHDIPSGYQDYRCWLEKNGEWGVLETIDEVFGYTDDDWWAHFEENLASVETLRIACEEAFQNYPNFGNDNFRDSDWYDAELSVERRMNNAYRDILASFYGWVMQLPQGNLKKRLMIHEKNSEFISFNYTKTLENLYGISPNRILYVHGKAGNGENLILGHGSSFSEIEKRMGERVDTGDYVYQRAKDAVVSAVSKHKKNVDDIIKKNAQWFSSISDVCIIHIYGHSLGDVDLPYFHKIFDCIDKNSIYVEISDYKKENIDRIHHFMKREHFKRNQYTMVELLSLCPKITL